MAGQPALYDISILLFISGYLAMREAEKLAVHLLMAWRLQKLMGMQSCMAGRLSGPSVLCGSNNWGMAGLLGR